MKNCREPDTPFPIDDPLEGLSDMAERNGRLFVPTGAGCSTASGIPDYRDRDGRWKHNDPIRYQEFVGSEAAHRRYWARSMIGWPRIERAFPNAAHRALAAMEHAGLVHQLVTQNVDGLHQSAGHRRVVDLHGRLGWVDCIQCRCRLPRSHLQKMLGQGNPGFDDHQALYAPDGDALVPEELECKLAVPDCPECGGVLKPSVVFFGENVPRSRVEHVRRKLRESKALLVVGSSLTVYSGFRFCREAAERGIPIAIVNLGRTRGDALAAHRLDAEVGVTLLRLAATLGIEVPE